MLSVDNINLFYGAAQALRSVSLKAEIGRVTCVLGRNGVGKSSLLRAIAKDHSVVVVEHDMAFVRELGVKVTVLHEGAVLAEGTLDQVSADERVIEVYLGR